jgi:hypothetical protein
VIALIQAAFIVVLELALRSWVWLALVPLAFGLATGARPLRAAARGAAAGLVSWMAGGLFFFLTSGRIIAGRMAVLFGLGAGRSWLMIAASGLLGALVAGLAAYAGASLRAALRGRRSAVNE